MMLPSQVASGNLTVYVLEIAMFMYVYMYIYVRMHNWIIGPIGLGFPWFSSSNSMGHVFEQTVCLLEANNHCSIYHHILVSFYSH